MKALQLCAALAIAAPAFCADFEGRIRMKSTDQGGAAKEFDYFIKGARARLEPRGGEKQGAVIFDAPARRMIALSDEEKRGIEMTLPDAKPWKAAKAAKKGSKFMKTGREAEILGYLCEEYLDSGEEGESEIWAAQGLGTFFGMGQAALAKSPGWTGKLKGAGFFPLKVVSRKGGKLRNTMEATEIEKKALEGSLFEVPDGYQITNMESLMQGLGAGAHPSPAGNWPATGPGTGAGMRPAPRRPPGNLDPEAFKRMMESSQRGKKEGKGE